MAEKKKSRKKQGKPEEFQKLLNGTCNMFKALKKLNNLK